MIKFFRKIRQKLLSENKFSKYLIYAIGEIILVIIGILIALSLNKLNEKKQAIVKVDSILGDVMKELETTINQGTRLIYAYRKADSITTLALSKELTYEDYNNTNSLWRLTTGWVNYEISDNAYRLLINNRDAIPEEYDKALSHLNALYDIHKPRVIEYNKMVKTLVKKNIDNLEHNHEWYADPSKKDEAIEYMMNDYRYRNQVKRFKNEAIYTHRNAIVDYRFKAIEAYKEIAKVLEKPTDSVKFIINKSTLKKYVGIYQENSNPQVNVKVYLEDNYLRLKRPGIAFDLYIDILNSETTFYLEPNGIVDFDSRNSGLVMTIYKGKLATEYNLID